MKEALALARLICLQHTPRMLIQEYIVVYDICYCDMAGRDMYFYKDCIVVEHVFCICPSYFMGVSHSTRVKPRSLVLL